MDILGATGLAYFWSKIKNRFAEMTEVASANIFDKNDITTPGAFLPWDGSIMEYAGMFYSYIPCEAGTYTFLAPSWFYTGNTGRIPLFDSNKDYIDEVTGTTTTFDENHDIVTITLTATEINAGCAYFGFSENVDLLSTLMIVKGTTYPASYVEPGSIRTIAGLQISMSQIVDFDPTGSALGGKIASFNGDSITAGSGNSGVGYPELIAASTGMTVENIAVGGATIATGTGAAHIISTSISDMRSDADIAVFSGGVNDADLHVTKGTVTSGYNDTLDTTTFAGAFEYTLKALINRYPGKKVGYIFTHKCGNFDEDYYSIAKQACEKWGVSFCNLYKETPSLAFIDALRTLYTSGADGYHPNQEGYEAYYVGRIIAWLKTL